MTLPRFELLREGRADCPSDFLLDRLDAKELSPTEAQPVERHLATCDVCTSRRAERSAGFDAFPSVDPRRMLARLRTAADEPAPGVGATVALWVRRALAPLLIAAAAIAIIPRHRDDGAVKETAAKENRTKGSLGLQVYRFAGEHSQPAVSGEHFAAGDRIRFTVTLPAPGQVSVIGVESSGMLYTAWPIEPGTPTLFPAGKDVELPGAVSLTDSKGRETLYLVRCAPGSAAPACASRGAGEPPVCPPDCDLSPFVLEKGQ